MLAIFPLSNIDWICRQIFSAIILKTKLLSRVMRRGCCSSDCVCFVNIRSILINDFYYLTRVIAKPIACHFNRTSFFHLVCLPYGCCFLQVSFFSTSPELSNKQRFEYFSRTIPSDHYQVQAMVDIVRTLGWSYISIIYEESNYGIKVSVFVYTMLTFDTCPIQSASHCFLFGLRFPQSPTTYDKSIAAEFMVQRGNRIVQLRSHVCRVRMKLNEIRREKKFLQIVRAMKFSVESDFRHFFSLRLRCAKTKTIPFLSFLTTIL